METIEKVIMGHIANTLSLYPKQADAAKMLGISKKTVKKHVRKIREKYPEFLDLLPLKMRKGRK